MTAQLGTDIVKESRNSRPSFRSFLYRTNQSQIASQRFRRSFVTVNVREGILVMLSLIENDCMYESCRGLSDPAPKVLNETYKPSHATRVFCLL